MQENTSKCSKRVGSEKSCPYCNGICIRYGKTISCRQRNKCKKCGRTHIDEYRYKAYDIATNEFIKDHLKEGCGIRSISRLLKISSKTVMKRIVWIAKMLVKPFVTLGKEYELDEMCTYVKRKTRKRWIVYAIDRTTKEVADFAVGRRTNRTIKQVTDTLVLSNASKVYTDKLPNYRSLLPAAIHCIKRSGTNHIERKNLTLRTHLKRLSRRTICFSRSMAMLTACLKIYFWG